MKRLKGSWLIRVMIFVILCIPLSAYAQEQAGEKGLQELKRQIDVLTEEIEKLKIGAVAEPKYERFMGLGPAASRVYTLDKGLSIGGYGEVIYSNFQESSKKDIADTQRFILYGGYKYNDRIIMNTELEFEHGGESDVFVEFSYLDFLLSSTFNLRAGLILVPIGIINEYHEPTVFHGVLRPDIERNIIPSTWREIGTMAFGKMGDLSYKIGILNGLNSAGFKSDSWIKGGRYKGIKANADNFAAVVNLNYGIFQGLNIGGTYYRGEAGEGKGEDEVKAGEKEGTVDLWEFHSDYRFKGLDIKGLYVRGSLDGNSALESAPPGSVGKEVEGWYIESAYDMMSLIRPGSEMSLSPFIRYEDYDTQKEIFTGSRDLKQDRIVTTAGIGFKPYPNVAIKADYQWRETESDLPAGKGAGLDENKIDQFNLGVGFIF